MIITTHIIVALLSVVFSGILYFKPKKSNFYVTFALIAATLLSGTYLVIQTHSSLAHACISGCVYLGVVMAGIIPAYKKISSNI